MTIHPEPHPLAGKTVTISDSAVDSVQGAVVSGAQYKIEDWWDRVGGKSWSEMNGNPGCLHYAFRAEANGLPADDEVVYGKIDAFGHLVHVSEIELTE